MSDGSIEIEGDGPFSDLPVGDGPSCCGTPEPILLTIRVGIYEVRCQCGQPWLYLYLHEPEP